MGKIIRKDREKNYMYLERSNPYIGLGVLSFGSWQREKRPLIVAGFTRSSECAEQNEVSKTLEIREKGLWGNTPC